MTADGLTVLDVLAQNGNEPTWKSLTQVWDAYAQERAVGSSPFAAAVRVASRADRLGQAFAVGYPAALEHLLPGVTLPAALCVTEAGGNRPSAIMTRLERAGSGFQLDGRKTFVTFGTLARTLIIAARTGETPDRRPQLVVVKVPADREGITIEQLPEMRFVPEIPHAAVSLRGVVVDDGERLPGDGYLGCVKPFRTVEDIHVIGACIGYLMGVVRRVSQNAALMAELAALLAALDRLRVEPPLDPHVHVALQGVYARLEDADQQGALARLWRTAPEEEGARWARDRVLLRVASEARAARFDRAWSAFFS